MGQGQYRSQYLCLFQVTTSQKVLKRVLKPHEYPPRAHRRQYDPSGRCPCLLTLPSFKIPCVPSRVCRARQYISETVQALARGCGRKRQKIPWPRACAHRRALRVDKTRSRTRKQICFGPIQEWIGVRREGTAKGAGWLHPLRFEGVGIADTLRARTKVPRPCGRAGSTKASRQFPRGLSRTWRVLLCSWARAGLHLAGFLRLLCGLQCFGACQRIVALPNHAPAAKPG